MDMRFLDRKLKEKDRTGTSCSVWKLWRVDASPLHDALWEDIMIAVISNTLLSACYSSDESETAWPEWEKWHLIQVLLKW